MSESGGSGSEMEPQWDSGQLEMPTAPQSKISESPLFQELRESVAKETMDFTFACGGAIPIVPSLLDAKEADSEKLRAMSCLPIDLRWDSKEEAIPSSHTKVTFPLEPNTEKNLHRLIKDMMPATFGLGGEQVRWASLRRNHGDISEGFGAIVEIVPVPSACLQLGLGGQRVSRSQGSCLCPAADPAVPSETHLAVREAREVDVLG